jgi:hypothetical protein
VSIRQAEGITVNPDNVSAETEDRDEGEDEKDLLPA